MATLGFTSPSFKVFEVTGFNARMHQLYAHVRPRLVRLGDDLAPELARILHLEFFPHVAKHARRTVNPPPETWAAFGPSARYRRPLSARSRDWRGRGQNPRRYQKIFVRGDLGRKRQRRGGAVGRDEDRHPRAPRDQHRLVAEMLGSRHIGQDAHHPSRILPPRPHPAGTGLCRAVARAVGWGGAPGRDPAVTDESSVAGRILARGWRNLPAMLTAAFAAVWWGWHVPVLYDTALRQPVVYGVEMITYLGAGVLLWRQMIGSRPYRPLRGRLHRIVLAVGTSVACTALGFVQVFGTGVMYPAYLGIQHHILSVVADQQVGGAVLWVIPLVPFSILAVALLIGWLNDEESESLAAGFDRLLKPPKSAWPSRPGLR